MLTGAQAMIRALEHEGVEIMFGIPGGTVLPLFDPLGFPSNRGGLLIDCCKL